MSGTEHIIRVMQSDGNSFYGDIFSDSCNKTFRNEDNILDQISKSRYVCINIMKILILNYKKMNTNTTVALKPNFMSSLLLSAVFHFIRIFYNNS